MKPIDQIWSLFLSWLKIKIQSPYSNLVTNVLLAVGAGIIATPLLEHLLFNAILKQWLGIDLGIEIPDIKAYVAGCVLMSLAAMHNLLFIKLSGDRDIQIKDAHKSVYRELWSHCDKAVDDVTRLKHLYMKELSDDDEKFVSQAEDSVIKFAEFLRLNRPFLFSEDFYNRGSSISSSCWVQTTYFRACMQKKAELEKEGESDYKFDIAYEVTNREMREIKEKYDRLCVEIREYVDAI